MVDGNRRWGCLITNSLVEFAAPRPGAGRDDHTCTSRTFGPRFAAALTRAAAEGELRPGAGPESAAMLVAVVQGMNVIAKSKPGRAAFDEIVEATLGGLVRVAPDP